MIVKKLRALSIGEVIGGRTPGNKPWREALDALTMEVVHMPSNTASDLNVNVVFFIPGNLARADFEGARTGSFSKKDRLLMVQVALPEEVPVDPRQYLRLALESAVDEAERWAVRRRLSGDFRTLRRIVRRLGEIGRA